jgi:hypothetical protein
MKRHRFDPLSFIFGACFLAVAGLFSLGGLTGLRADALRWIGAAALLFAGVVLLFGSRSQTNDKT